MSQTSRGPALLILSATLLATTGTGISIIAFPWLALQHHDRARDASIVAAAMTLPLVLSTLVAGTAVDFVGRRRVSLVVRLAVLRGGGRRPADRPAVRCGRDQRRRAGRVGLLPAAFDPAGTTARQSMLPEAAARAGWSLDRTNSSYEAVLNLGFMVGPGIGGLMIATVGGVNTMWITAGCFGLSLFAIGALRLRAPASPTTRPAPTGWRPASSKGCDSSGICGCSGRSG